MSLPDWDGRHASALAFIGGALACAVGARQSEGRVDQQDEPGLNRTYLDMVDALRHRDPADAQQKAAQAAKAEVAVLVVERWIPARSRNRRFSPCSPS